MESSTPEMTQSEYSLSQRLGAETVGTAGLLACVVGSGIAAETLAGGNIALALLANAIATGTMLVVLILAFAPISGAHFNPAVTLAFYLRREIARREAAFYTGAQVIGAVAGVWMAHAMFDLDIVQTSVKARTGFGQWLGEAVASFGLLSTILALVRGRGEAIPYAVGLYITAAYWFTSSTSFANPAVSVARAMTKSFAGIAPADVPAFLAAQIVGSVSAVLFWRWMQKR